MLKSHRNGVVTLEGQAARQHLIEHHACTVDIAALVKALALGLLRRDVMNAAQCFLRQGLIGIGKAGDTEVGYLHRAVTEHHDILRLNIAVDNATGMGVAQTAHDVGDEVQRLAPVHMIAALHILLEGNAIQQLHDDILDALRRGHVVNRHNIGVAQLGNCQRLVAEAAAELGILCQIALQNLYSDQAVQAMTLGLIHVCHAARANEFQQLIAVIQHFSYILIQSIISFHCCISTTVTLSGAPLSQESFTRRDKQPSRSLSWMTSNKISCSETVFTRPSVHSSRNSPSCSLTVK